MYNIDLADELGQPLSSCPLNGMIHCALKMRRRGLVASLALLCLGLSACAPVAVKRSQPAVHPPTTQASQEALRASKAAEAQTRKSRAYVDAVHAYLQGNDARAAKIAKRLAYESDQFDAQYLLGLLYWQGRGLPRNKPLGLAWIERAAAGGSALAQADLASRYLQGHGLPRDPFLARRWALKAATRGQRRAESVLCVLDHHDHRQGAARQWCQKGAEQGDALSQFFLARTLGQSATPADKRRARHWMRQAAAQGLIPAQLHLGDYFHEGIGGKRDNRQAIRWWRQAARAGNGRAQLAVARAYAKGWGVKPDAFTAYAWLLAASRSNAQDSTLRRALQNQLTAQQRLKAKRRSHALTTVSDHG